MLERKSFSIAELKADADEPGVFHALVAVFGNVDKVGDRIVKGAFAKTLQERGLPPIVWSHQWNTPPIGEALKAVETDRGLEVKARLFVKDEEDHAVARQVYAGLKAGAIREFSFAFETREASTVTEDGEDIRELKDLDLFEVGPTLVGANPETELISSPKSMATLYGIPTASTNSLSANYTLVASTVKALPVEHENDPEQVALLLTEPPPVFLNDAPAN